MRKRFSDRVERARVTSGHYGSSHGDDFGFFLLHTNSGVPLKVIASAGDAEVLWEHVSVSTPTRCPSWVEMCWVKSLFWDDDEWVVQFHPAKDAYVNYHPFCLHLWRPTSMPMPTPPSIAVGPKTSAPLEMP